MLGDHIVRCHSWATSSGAAIGAGPDDRTNGRKAPKEDNGFAPESGHWLRSALRKGLKSSKVREGRVSYPAAEARKAKRDASFARLEASRPSALEAASLTATGAKDRHAEGCGGLT